MRSPADGARRGRARLLVERSLRVAAYIALAAWIWLALRPRASVEVARESELVDARVRWTLTPTDSVHVHLDTAPDASSRAWLLALRGAGTTVSWSTESIDAVALETYPAIAPTGGIIVLAAAGSRSASVAVLSDSLGIIDSLTVGQSPSLVKLGDPEGHITLTAGAQPARAPVAPFVTPRRVFVAGAAGWEAKFIIAALEEAGWQVDADLFVGPGHNVTQNARRVVDTARHAAVVFVDSTAIARVRGVEEFVRQGGGLVLVGDASRSRAVAPLITWRAGRRQNAPLGTLPGDTTWRGLTRVPLDTVGPGVAIALERREGRPVVIARRHHAGRVLGVGYDETWRWRMAGDASSVAEHRAWWSGLLASVALRPTPSAHVATGAAPLASLHAELGPPSSVSPAPPVIQRDVLMNLLGALALASLLGEWLLRRLRGAP